MSAALVNYEVRRKDKQFSSNGTSAEVLTIRGRHSNREGKDEPGRSKSKSGFTDLKKNQCAFCKELEHWNIDCPRIKDKNKESKINANLTRVINSQSDSISQAGGSNSDSMIFSFSVTPPTIGYSGDSEWMLDTRATYHVCPNIGFLTLRRYMDILLS